MVITVIGARGPYKGRFEERVQSSGEFAVLFTSTSDELSGVAGGRFYPLKKVGRAQAGAYLDIKGDQVRRLFGFGGEERAGNER